MMMVRRGARPCVQPLRRSTTLRAWHLVPGAWQVVSGAPQRTPFPSALQPCQQRSIRRWSRSPCQLLRMHRRRAPRFEAGERSRPHPYRVAKVSALLEAPTPSPRPSPHSFGAGSTWALCRWRTSATKSSWGRIRGLISTSYIRNSYFRFGAKARKKRFSLPCASPLASPSTHPQSTPSAGLTSICARTITQNHVHVCASAATMGSDKQNTRGRSPTACFCTCRPQAPSAVHGIPVSTPTTRASGTEASPPAPARATEGCRRTACGRP
jgi:hypothetical protein